MTSWYDRHILPRLIESGCSQPPMTRLRQRYVPMAKGNVLEIGIGSGLNLPHYGDGVARVTGVDPSAELGERARERAERTAVEVDVIGLSGENLPSEDNSFDTVVCTWTLCTIPSPMQAITEMRRVLKPSGQLLFVEHGLSNEASVAKWQRRIEPLWKTIAGGCHLTRRADRLLEEGGFSVDQLECGYELGPKIAGFMFHGVATPR